MQKINKLTGLASKKAAEMSVDDKLDIKTIGDDLKLIVDNILAYVNQAQPKIKRYVYPDYVTFNDEADEAEYLSLDTLAEKDLYLLENEDKYAINADLHPNISLLYATPEETNKMIAICKAVDTLKEENEGLPEDFFNAFKRYFIMIGG